MSKTLTLRLDGSSAAELDKISGLMEVKTASKTVLWLIDGYEGMLVDLAQKDDYIRELEEKLAVAQQKIENSRTAALALLDTVGHEDIFTG